MSVPVIGERYLKVMELMDQGNNVTESCKMLDMSPQAFYAACHREPKLKQMYEEFKAAKAAALHNKIAEVGGNIVDKYEMDESSSHQELKVAFDMVQFFLKTHGPGSEQYRPAGPVQATQVNIWNDLTGEAQGFSDLFDAHPASVEQDQATQDAETQE